MIKRQQKQSHESAISKLLEIMATLRDPVHGCPWDREQTFASIAPYTIEEAYEVADAIAREAHEELAEELGDLLLQVVFHARMAEEARLFDFADVARAICEKLIRRHPHVFGGERIDGAAEQTEAWEALKRRERAAKAAAGVLGGVPVGLPALTRAAKLGRRAAAVGFDWPDAGGVRDKVDEELRELDAARAAGDREAVAAEMGDVLFALANLCRHLELDPEDCLRGANRRFETRFRHVEARVAAAGGDWSAFDAAALEALWEEAKRR
ncbi:MAG TPA: nucleoside triphosphate pyrophosphohydrolase [Gammaproteobacteria bacterium]